MLREIFHSVKAVFFDFDNTLVSRDDSFRQILPSWFRRAVPDLPEEEYENHIQRILEQDESGFSSRRKFASWIRTFYNITDMTEHDILADFSASIAGNINKNDHVIDFLCSLKRDYLIGVISNGSSKTQRLKLQNAGLHSLFDPDKIYIEEEMGFAKPDPSMFAFPTLDHKISPAEILFIGDHPINDIHGASLAGLRTCWVKGKQPLSVLVIKPALIIETIHDLFSTNPVDA